MKRLLCISIALLLLLAGCTAPDAGRSYTQGVYALSLSVKQVAGSHANNWEFVYTHDGKTIKSGHRIVSSLEIFAFCSVRVDVREKAFPENQYSATLSAALSDGGSGETEITVTATDGETATFAVTCKVKQVGKR